MAVGRYIAHRKLADGSYEDVYTKSESGLIYRPNGRTVEQDLAAYLPEYQNSDDVPKSLTDGKSIVTPNHVYTKLGNGTIRDLTLDTNTDTVYTHPSYKVCNYSYTHPSEKQCNYSVDLSNYVTKSEVTNYVIRAGSGTASLNGSSSSSFTGEDTFTVSFDQINTIIGLVITGRLYDSRNRKYNPCGMCVQSINSNSATIACGYAVCFGTSWNPSVTYNYIVIGK